MQRGGLLLGLLLLGAGVLLAPRLYAALFGYIYPAGRQIVIERSYQPAEFSSIGPGGCITATLLITNQESIDLRGFYYSDQVPTGWAMETVGVWIDGVPVTDYDYRPGSAGGIYPGTTAHRWSLELPQGGGSFIPAHPISALGGTARIVYRMTVASGQGDDYQPGYEAWAGWLETLPTGSAIFGYQGLPVPPTVTSTPLSPSPTPSHTPVLPSPTHTPMPPSSTPTNTPGSPSPTHTGTPVTPAPTGTVPSPPPTPLPSLTPSATPTATPAPPEADFDASDRLGVYPFLVYFTDESHGMIDSWHWDFGDGHTGTDQHPDHTYRYAGQYTVSLVVHGPGGVDTLVEPRYIRVYDELQTMFFPQLFRGNAP